MICAMALSIDEARARVLAAIRRPLPSEDVAVHEALGRVLAEDVAAERDVPSFANSAMDGFAVRSGPAGARWESSASRAPARPPRSASARARRCASPPARRCPTAPTPSCRSSGSTVDGVRVTLGEDVEPGRNVRPAGDDVRAGATVLTAGTRLGAAEIGVAVTLRARRGRLRAGSARRRARHRR